MLTLAEFSKRIVNDPVRKAVVQLYPESSQLLAMLPFQDIAGNAVTRLLEDSSNPTGAATRAINVDYTESTAQSTEVSRTLIMMGGECSIDRYELQTQAGNEVDIMMDEIIRKVRGTSRLFDKLFIQGDSGTTATEFDGLSLSIDSGQVSNINTTAGGGALTLTKLDGMIDAVEGTPSALIMNKRMIRIVNNLVRAAGQATEVVADEFGRLITYYGGIPIIKMSVDNTFAEILAYDEDDTQASPASASCSSIYAARFGEDGGVYGIQSCAPIVDQQGWSGNSKTTVIDHFCNILIPNPKSISKLAGIADV